jgi:hypothetical protein
MVFVFVYFMQEETLRRADPRTRTSTKYLNKMQKHKNNSSYFALSYLCFIYLFINILILIFWGLLFRNLFAFVPANMRPF